MKQPYVSTLISQNFTSGEKSLARQNIDAVSSADVENQIDSHISSLDYEDSPVSHQFVTSVSETDGIVSITRRQPQISDVDGLEDALRERLNKIQSDWDQADIEKASYIKNKPENLVQDSAYVHTDNNFTDDEKAKLAGIASGAEVNVQSDWTEADLSSDAYIKNKPANLVQDASYVHTDNNFTTTLKNKLDSIAASAEVNVQSNWNETNNSSDAYIQNKPQNLVQDASYVHTDNNFTNTLKNKLDGIAAGAEVNQNAFANVKVGSTTIAADSKTDTLEIAAGSNVTLTPDASGDKVTIAAEDTKYTAGTGLTLSSGQFSVTNPFTTTDKTKLDGIASGAQVNQNAFSNVKVGNTTVQADSTTDTLELAAGSNITLTPDATNDKVTIAATDTTYTAGNGLVLTGTTFSVASNVSSRKASLMGATHAGSGTGSSSAFLNVPSRTTQGTWVQYSRNGATFNGNDYTMSGRFSFTAFMNLLGSFRYDDADGAIDFAFVFHPTNCTLYFPEYTTTAIDGGQGVLISLTSAKNESVMLKSVLLDVNPTDLSNYSVNVKWYFRISGNLTNIWETPVQMSNLLTLCQPNYMLNEAVNYRIKAQGASWSPGLANIGCGFCMQAFN